MKLLNFINFSDQFNWLRKLPWQFFLKLCIITRFSHCTRLLNDVIAYNEKCKVTFVTNTEGFRICDENCRASAALGNRFPASRRDSTFTLTLFVTRRFGKYIYLFMSVYHRHVPSFYCAGDVQNHYIIVFHILLNC